MSWTLDARLILHILPQPSRQQQAKPYRFLAKIAFGSGAASPVPPPPTPHRSCSVSRSAPAHLVAATRPASTTSSSSLLILVGSRLFSARQLYWNQLIRTNVVVTRVTSVLPQLSFATTANVPLFGPFYQAWILSSVNPMDHLRLTWNRLHPARHTDVHNPTHHPMRDSLDNDLIFEDNVPNGSGQPGLSRWHNFCLR